MTFPINLLVSGSQMIVTGAVPPASMEIRVPLTASQLAIGSVSLGSGSVAGDLVVNGTLFANEFKTNIVSSSIIYRSGSTKQGDSLDDIHEVTGSLRVVGGISGSLSGTFFGTGQGSFSGTEGLTGSLQRLVSGQTYLVGGAHISIVTQSNGQILIIATEVADVSASYVVVGTTGSLPNERFLYSGIGLLLTDNGPGLGIGYTIDNNIVATVSGTRFTGPVDAFGGLTGSLQRLSSGETYLAGAGAVSVTTQSNGQVLVSSSLGTGRDAWIDGNGRLKTTSSVSVSSDGNYAESIGSDVYFYVSGTVGVPSGSANARRVAVFGGDVRVSGSLTVGSGSVTIDSNQVRYNAAGGSVKMGGGADDTWSIVRSDGKLMLAVAAFFGVAPLFVIGSDFGSKLGGMGMNVPSSGAGETFRVFGSEAAPGGGRGGDVELFGGSGSGGPHGDVRVGNQAGDTYALFGPLSASILTPLSAAAGLSGSLQRITPDLTYLAAGAGIAIVTQSNGQVLVSNTFAVTASWADVSASYVTLGSTGSLPNERVLSASSGITMTDGGAGGFVDLRLNLSGGVGIQVVTGALGGVLITASTGSVQSSNFVVPREVKHVIFSGTTGHVTATLSSDPHLWQEHVFKDASGQSATNNIIISASAGHRIDGGFGHEISSSYGRARLLFVGDGLWSLID